jgi:hypothetical protein
VIARRTFVLSLGTSPIWIPTLGCQSKPPETPLAHLYGQDWVHGAYSLYATKYQGVQTSAESNSKTAYRVLAQKGVVSLEALQSRDVPFFMRVDPDAQSFAIERDVPERLTFTAGMSDADRDAATKQWEKAREHIHTDYEEIRRLNWALTTLLQQLQQIRNAIESGKTEQFRLVRQLSVMNEGGQPPFQLPYQVTNVDYSMILALLLERLDDDKTRLARMESDIAAVGLITRATDAGSGSLSSNIHKLLLAVVRDADATEPRAPAFPQQQNERDKLIAHGKQLYDTIKASPEYVAWEKAEREKAWDQIGSMLSMLDSLTGLKTSVIYHQLLDIWRGDADYLSYLKSAIGMLPFGQEVLKTVNQAVEITEKVRGAVGKVEQGIAVAQRGIGDLQGGDLDSVLQATKDTGLLNTASQFARTKIDKQLSFYKDQQEVTEVTSAIQDTPLLRDMIPKDLPELPKLPGEQEQ